MLLDYYPEIYRFKTLPIESQVCPECLKLFSPEIVLSKQLSICGDVEFLEKEEMEMDYYSSLFEDGDEDEYIDDIDF